ncbi:penicillin acylase family protein [Pelomonas sp. SE-A7]|uniref:penicillin acylase family protein n=1 Tax=Pelomonas sp. SE-A7 TaxID=3054953 RepID=UPI00259C76B1|nr:penicillin acylase family protein [Pelomonas sp. SE-A7]MDM4765705.1 penicillin acylase family protein [Pelomonas sp. SE-A7]
MTVLNSRLRLALLCAALLTPVAQAADKRDVTIARDHWGIAHIHGKTDADAVFGMMYAQAEDDFPRIEQNFLQALGRLAEADGESALYRDLRQRLFIDPVQLKKQYASSPAWLRALMDAWAGGLNLYLQKHPEVKPRVLTRFEPWMALAFSEGSIGGDIERVSVSQLQAFYDKTRPQQLAEAMPVTVEPTGSNGFAVAPQRSASGHALLWINPHTSFFFRSEQQVRSDQGLNAYGAATWGQFFIYQGFNARLGWMHTSSTVDNIDEYLETVEQAKDGRWQYRHGKASKPFQVREVELAYRTASGELARRSFTTYRSHHGPVVRQDGERWVSAALMEAPQKALMQSFLRTKARNLKEFRATLDLHTNSSNNTVYADADGNIAYFHANFIPRRDTRFDWTRPVDGSDPATDWGPPLSLDQSPNAINPRSGWVQNTNNWPYSVAGPEHSPRRQDYAAYVDAGEENPRGVHAVRLLGERSGLNPESLAALAFDPDQPAFDWLLPQVFKAFDAATPEAQSGLAEPVALLRRWDHRWANESVANTLANLWADEVWARLSEPARKLRMPLYAYMETRSPPDVLLAALAAVTARLQADFGDWRQPWGELNRFQRESSAIKQEFSDDKPSLAVPFTSARWGSLASFGARRYPGTKRWYGDSGNSFLAAVEFGPRLRAIAISAGGQSGHADSPHFKDQAQRFVEGRLREVLFHDDQLKGHVQRRYRPGD